jgi:hypothetical protein
MKYIIEPCPALATFDYEKPTRADLLGEPGRITSQIIKLLKEAELVIADLTTNNANVYYELSLRHAIGGCAIHMALADTNVSFDLYDNRTIFYTLECRSAEAARDELCKQIRRVHQEGYKPNNPILEAIGIINLQRSTDPNEKVLGQLLSSMETLTSDVRGVQSAVRALQVNELRPTTFEALVPYARSIDPYGRSSNALNKAAALYYRSGDVAVDTPPSASTIITTLPSST